MRLGLFGGTFDPPHTGHLIVAQDAALALGLDRIVFVPAAMPPHKRHVPVTDARHRRRMLELAIAANPMFALDSIELERAGPSYTVDTLRELRHRGGAEWTLLLGADQYTEFDSWREPDEIRQLATVAVLERSGTRDVATGSDVVHVNVTRIDISSTAIRDRVADGQSIRYLVPAAVEAYIYEAGLYIRNGTSRVG